MGRAFRPPKRIKKMSISSYAAKKLDARTITGLALFVALEISLCFVTNYVQFGAVNINLALFPIVLGACFYGPWFGLFLGAVNGLITIFAPATAAFINVSPVATVCLCLLKTALAGFFAGLFHKIIAKKNHLVAAFVAAVTVPVVNTLLFILGAFFFFADLFATLVPEGKTLFVFLITTFIGLNFLIEIVSNLVIDPAIYKALLHIFPKKKQLPLRNGQVEAGESIESPIAENKEQEREADDQA